MKPINWTKDEMEVILSKMTPKEMKECFMEYIFCNSRLEENRCIVGVNPMKDDIFIKKNSGWLLEDISEMTSQIDDKTSNTAISNYFHHDVEQTSKNKVYKEACKMPLKNSMIKEISTKNKVLLTA